MAEPILFPDAVEIACDYLDSLVGEPVFSRVPNPRPPEFYTITRTGGVQRNIVTDEPQLTVEAWAQTDAEAQDMAQIARAYLHAAVGVVVNGTAIYRVDELAGPSNFPDPISGQPRYSQSFSVAARGEVLTGS